MLTDEQLEIISEALQPLFQNLEHEVIVDIARRIKKTMTYTRTAELQAMEMQRLGFSPARIRKEARRRLGPGKIVGVSARTVEQAVRAWEDGADYLGVGAVFHTGSKADARQIDHDTLRRICAAVPIPAVAIGGITEENVLQLKGSGISGIAVISAVFAKEDVQAAAERLRKLAESVVETPKEQKAGDRQ